MISRAKSHWGWARSTAWDPGKVCGGRTCPGEREEPPEGSKNERGQAEVNPKATHAHGHAHTHGHNTDLLKPNTHTLPPKHPSANTEQMPRQNTVFPRKKVKVLSLFVLLLSAGSPGQLETPGLGGEGDVHSPRTRNKKVKIRPAIE